MRALYPLALGFLLLASTTAREARGQVSPRQSPVRTVRIVPGPEYAAGGLHRTIFGDLWRDLWTTEIEVEVLDLKTFAGGLRPKKRGGGFQTKSLRFTGADGREYKFRSLDKDPKTVLAPELRESVVADIVQDLISTSNPVSPLVAAPLLDAVGVLNARPRIVLLPNDPALGEFQTDFGGLLGMLEENPTDDDEETAFAGSDKVVTTYKLFRRLEEDNDEQVDARSYLRARLVDIFMGDWDRHVDQWKWARFREGNREYWQPIPRDRDQAFCRYDGLVPWIAETAVTQIEGCDDYYPKIEDLTWSGRYLDRKFLVPLDRETWDSITDDVVSRLTDSVIRYAVAQMPREMYAKEGARLERTLLSRRDGLREASEQFYRTIAKVVEVRGSDKAECVDVDRLDVDRLRVTLYKRDRNTGRTKGTPLFDRTFRTDETREVRIRLFGGDDSAHIAGHVDRSPIVRVIGGGGSDTFADDSRVDGYFLSVTPIPDAETSAYFYDSGDKSTFHEGPSTSVDRTAYPEPKNDTLKWEPPVRDYGHDWRFGPWFNYTPDEGVFIGGGPILYEFGFRAVPYVYRMDLRAGYATAANRFKAQYVGDFFTLLGGLHLNILARGSGLEVLHFYGLGNDTEVETWRDEEEYYKIEQQQFIFRPGIEGTVADGVHLRFGGGIEHIETEIREGTFLGDMERTDTSFYGAHNTTLASLGLGITVDTRNDATFPTSGFYLAAEGTYYPNAFDLTEAFTRAKVDARTYLPIPYFSRSTIALRVGAEKLWGAYPFFKAAFLGGTPTLRGYERERFAGDAAIYGNIEFRFFVSNFNVLVPGYWGVLFAGDIGRIIMDDVGSDTMHGSSGAGLWVAPVDLANTISIAIMRTRKQTGVYVTGGFMF